MASHEEPEGTCSSVKTDKDNEGRNNLSNGHNTVLTHRQEEPKIIQSNNNEKLNGEMMRESNGKAYDQEGSIDNIGSGRGTGPAAAGSHGEKKKTPPERRRLRSAHGDEEEFMALDVFSRNKRKGRPRKGSLLAVNDDDENTTDDAESMILLSSESLISDDKVPLSTSKGKVIVESVISKNGHRQKWRQGRSQLGSIPPARAPNLAGPAQDRCRITHRCGITHEM